MTSDESDIEVFPGDPSKIVENIIKKDKEKRKGIIDFNDPKEFIKNIYSYDILIQNPLYKSLCDTNTGLVQEIKDLKLQNESILEEMQKLKENQADMENLLDEIGIEESYESLSNFVKFLYENKNNFIEFVNIKNNNNKETKEINSSYNIEEEEKYILLKNENIKMQEQIDELNSKINSFSSNKNINDKINQEINKFKEKQDLKHKEEIKIYKKNIQDLEEKLKVKVSIPTPSSSTENKNNKKNNESDDVLQLPDNINEVVYYRNIKGNYSYFKSEGKKYLRCCGIEYSDKEINHTNSITCFKCFRSFYLSKEVDKNNMYKIFVKILQEHIISNEDEIYEKIKCNNNNCNFVSKKEIKLCIKCCKENYGRDFISNFKVFNKPSDNDNFYKSKTVAAEETYSKLLHLNRLYEVAESEGIDVNNFNEIVEYIKQNKLLEDKQKNIIKFKIQRASCIIKLYNNEKYSEIQNYIKRINFKIKDLSKLSHEQWLLFKKFLQDNLDEELKNMNVNKNNNKDEINFGLCIFPKCKNIKEFENFCNYHKPIFENIIIK